MKDRPTIFIAACIILSICMSAFLQCSSYEPVSEQQFEAGYSENTGSEDDANSLPGEEKQVAHFETPANEEN